jgi:excisionase family DNA binding protein
MNPPSQTSRCQYESIAVAATRVGVSSKTVHRWIASGQLGSYRIGTGLLRVDPEELDRLLTLPSDVSPVSARRGGRDAQ